MINFNTQQASMVANHHTCRQTFANWKGYYLHYITLLWTALSSLVSTPFAQSTTHSQIDSLISLSKTKLRINSINPNSLDEFCVPYSKKNMEIAGSLAENALDKAQKIQYLRGIAEATKILGKIENTLFDDLSLADKHFDTALKYYKQIGNEKEMAWIWGASGYSKWVAGKFPQSMEAFGNAEQLLKKIRDTANLLILYNWVSQAYIEWGKYDSALQSLLTRKQFSSDENVRIFCMLYSKIGDNKTALSYARKDDISEPWADFSLASCLYDNKQYDSALYYYRLFEKFARETGDGPISKLYAALGKVYQSMGNDDSALWYLTTSLRMHEKANDVNQVMVVLPSLSETYLTINNLAEAKRCAEELLQYATVTSAEHYVRDAHYLLYQVFDRSAKKDSAFFHLKVYTVLKNKIDEYLTFQKLSFYQILTAKEKDEARIDLLKKEKELQQRIFVQTRQQKNILLTGLLALSVIGFISIRNILLKRKNERLRMETKIEIQQLENEKSKATLLQQSSELKMQALRAQMNPHFIYNALSSINLFIRQHNTDLASDYLIKFSRLIRLILHHSQSAFISLDSELAALTLYLELEAMRFDHHFTYSITCADDLDLSAIKVPPLIIQPYVENAIWHGLMHKQENGKLDVIIFLSDDFLCFKITDNGVGRKQASAIKTKTDPGYKSVGIKLSADRIDLLQHQQSQKTYVFITDLVMADGSAGGTEVFLKIPLQYDQNNSDR